MHASHILFILRFVEHSSKWCFLHSDYVHLLELGIFLRNGDHQKAANHYGAVCMLLTLCQVMTALPKRLNVGAIKVCAVHRERATDAGMATSVWVSHN